MLRHLEQKPAIGIIAGAVAGCLSRIEHFLTDDHSMRLVSGVGTCAGALVAVISLVLWLVKARRELKPSKR